MKQLKIVLFVWLLGLLCPVTGYSQGLAGQISGLQSVLGDLYDQMMPLCEKLISVGRGIAGFAALWYIASRVWRHLAAAEPIDIYPLLRPFALGFAILIFPKVIAMINGILSPTVTATAAMVQGSNQAIAVLLKQKEQAVKESEGWQMFVGQTGGGDKDKWLKYTYGESYSEGLLEGLGNDVKFYMAKESYNFRNAIKAWISQILQIIFESAALCINTMRTFHLIVLAIIGPIAFGISVFDGFQHTLSGWIARYINIYLWLPVANIFGAIIAVIQQKMIELDISQIKTQGDTTFGAHDSAYLIFLIIGIVGYFSVPSVAGYIIHAGGGNALTHKVSSLFASTVTTVISTAAAAGRGFGSIARSAVPDRKTKS